MKQIRTDRMSRVTKTSKAHPGIKVSEDATDSQPRPYEGYRRGRGMPSAREPVENFSTQAGKVIDKVYGHEEGKLMQNAKIDKVCKRTDCGAYSTRKSSGCALFPFDISKCSIKDNKAIGLK